MKNTVRIPANRCCIDEFTLETELFGLEEGWLLSCIGLLCFFLIPFLDFTVAIMGRVVAPEAII